MEITYQEYQRERQNKFNAIPIGAAFSDEQFERTMRNWGLTVNDTDKLVSLGNGAFIQKKDYHLIEKFLSEDKLKEFMQDKEFRKGAFLHELCNHEYMYNNQGNWEVCNLFYDDEEDLPFLDAKESKSYISYLKMMGHEEWIPEYEEAVKEYYRLADENEWG